MRKQEGFKGQRSVILPEFIIDEMRKQPLGSQLFLTDIGYYPDAQFHHRTRKEGCMQYILIYCTSGEGWFSIEGKKSTVSANQFFIIPKGVSHAYGSNSNRPWSIYWLHFSGQLASHFIDISGNTKSITPCKVSRIEDRLQLFEEILQNLEMGYSYENLNYANICLWHFLASFKYLRQFRQLRATQEKDFIKDTIFFMKDNIASKVSLDTLAGNLGLSPSHFSLIFRNKTGRSPMDYLIHLRIQRACQLLDNSDWKVKEIALQVGFEDPYYFSRIFKKVMNHSPIKYRQLLKG